MQKNTSTKNSDTSCSNKVKRVLSGIRPTNRLHIGNYFGAVKGMLELQEDPNYETFYMAVDLHTLTTPYEKDDLAVNRREIIIDYLAAGLDPEKSTLFIQSMVPYHSELAFYLSSLITVGRLQHLPTFKDKVKQHPDNVTLALLGYPVLMAADILLYKADAVPVGIDQEPHIEISRLLARKLNTICDSEFPEPERFATKGEYIPSLLGEGKMSKSVEGSYINLIDNLETIQERLAKIPTDSGKGNSVPDNGSIANLLSFVELFEGSDKRKEYEQLYVGNGIRYNDLKRSLAKSIHETLLPIQEKREEIIKYPNYIDDVINEGAKKASTVARKTVEEVKIALGL